MECATTAACFAERRRGILSDVNAYPLHAHLILTSPRRVAERLERVRASGMVDEVPNLFQIELGVVRMWLRVLFRSDTVGTSHAAPRPNVRARLLEKRALRFPFLVREQAIAPLDHSGLVSSPERVTKHLLAAHHDKHQFSYDLEMLALEPGVLDALVARARAVASSDDPRARWLKDLAVYDGYHDNLVRAAEKAQRGDFGLPFPDADDPDVSFRAYLRWCARQPKDAAGLLDALRRGTLDLGAYRPVRRPGDGEPSRDELVRMSRTERFAWLALGHPIDVDALAGGLYRGTRLGRAAALEARAGDTFQKAFVRDEARGGLRGFDVRLRSEGEGPDARHEPERDARGVPRAAGHFTVRRACSGEIPVPASNALLLDYAGLPRVNALGRRARREAIVALRAGSVERLLGWSYLDVRGVAVGTPRFFLLEREGTVSGVPDLDRPRRMDT